jgi:hypothetical protein
MKPLKLIGKRLTDLDDVLQVNNKHLLVTVRYALLHLKLR